MGSLGTVIPDLPEAREFALIERRRRGGGGKRLETRQHARVDLHQARAREGRALMGVGDGNVIGLTKIHDSGPPAQRFNLVLVAEGFTVFQQQLFQTRAQEFTDFFFSQAPFDDEQVACAINVYRLDVVSDEEGADAPACGDEPPVLSRKCGRTSMRRSAPPAQLDARSAETTFSSSRQCWPCCQRSTEILVIVNHPSVKAWVDSSGGRPPVGSSGKKSPCTRWGTSRFSSPTSTDCLTCLPGETGHDHYPDPEPCEPNITIEPDPRAREVVGSCHRRSRCADDGQPGLFPDQRRAGNPYPWE